MATRCQFEDTLVDAGGTIVAAPFRRDRTLGLLGVGFVGLRRLRNRTSTVS